MVNSTLGLNFVRAEYLITTYLLIRYRRWEVWIQGVIAGIHFVLPFNVSPEVCLHPLAACEFYLQKNTSQILLKTNAAHLDLPLKLLVMYFMTDFHCCNH